MNGRASHFYRGSSLIGYTNGLNEVNFYQFNAHGDVVSVLDCFGNTIRNYDYDAFGKQKDDLDSFYRNQYGTAVDDNPFRYCGEYFDDETGLIYLRARYYDPDIQRFVAEDTHWNPSNMIYGDDGHEDEDVRIANITAIIQSINMYAYCMNNPVKYIDLSGEAVTPANIVSGLVGAGVGALIGTAIANHYNLKGWKRSAVVAGGATLTGVVAWFAGPAILSACKTAITGAIGAGTLAVDKIPSWISNALGVGKYFATKAVQGVSNFVVSTKHLMNAGGNYAKFNTDSTTTVNQWVTQALTKADKFIANSKDSYYTIVNMGQKVGSGGEEFIKVVFSTAGKIITAYPVK